MSEIEKGQVNNICADFTQMGEHERELLIAYADGLKAGFKVAIRKAEDEANSQIGN